ncbi:MAG: CocE/NonD family hydrolase [Lysobacterales bacterium]|nr:MAG: CocE/NonD family hydrolase [Xanthomonadales bacterium]
MLKPRSHSLGSRLARLVLISVVFIPLVTAFPSLAADDARPAPRHSDVSYYLTMRDDIRIAVSFYFPSGSVPASPAPAVLMQTRYGRAGIGRWPRTQRWLDDGFVVVAVDTRGSTASFGTRYTELAPESIADMDELIRHVAAQPWSNGKVFAAGQSYAADTADFATSRSAPALIGAVIHETDFDVFLRVVAPGGVVNRGFLSDWGMMTRAMDLGRAPTGMPGGEAIANADCRRNAADCASLYPILQPVDDDASFEQLRAALEAKRRWLPTDLLNITFREDVGHNGHSFLAMSPASALEGIRREKKPVQYWGSWMDGGTAEAALARFRSAPEVPMELWITANDHSNIRNADPFDPARMIPVPTFDEQNDIQSDFVSHVMAGKTIPRLINYYVLGTGEMRVTDVWPPRGTHSRTLHFSGDHALAANAGPANSHTYDVDAEVGTGTQTRWSTQIGVPPAYGDRREMDRRLLTYDSEPFAKAVEVVGSVVVELSVEAASEDPAFFAYLEDVAPDGRVTYITEGMLRAIHRRPADPASLPYDQGPAPHSFRRADAQLVTPGERMQVRFALFPTAARIERGHKLRIAIAGADASTFTFYPHNGHERFVVHVGDEGSFVELPLREVD